jgi:hypothetical protein
LIVTPETCERCGKPVTLEDVKRSPLAVIVDPLRNYTERLVRCKPCGWFRYEFRPRDDARP